MDCLCKYFSDSYPCQWQECCYKVRHFYQITLVLTPSTYIVYLPTLKLHVERLSKCQGCKRVFNKGPENMSNNVHFLYFCTEKTCTRKPETRLEGLKSGNSLNSYIPACILRHCTNNATQVLARITNPPVQPEILRPYINKLPSPIGVSVTTSKFTLVCIGVSF